ncbi:MAG: MFS transporter [SAR202 cluster bacterium]|nr:MFS transporter [SAR202 cluster bacterium]
MGADREARPRRLELLLIVSGIVALAQGVNGFAVPALPKLVDAVGGTAVTLGLAVGFYSIARMFVNIPAGLLSDRVGRRWVLVGGGLVTALGSTLSGAVTSVPMLLALRLVTGAGAAAAITAGFIAISDLSDTHNRARSLGVLQGWQFLSGVASPALGGFITEWFGMRVPFYVSGAGVAAVAVYGALRIPETRPARPSSSEVAAGRPDPFGALGQLLRNRNYMLVSGVVVALFFTRFGANQSVVPLFAYDRLGWSAGQLGLLYSGAAILNGLLILPSAHVSDRVGRKVAIVPAGLVAVAGLALLSVATAPWVFIMAYLLVTGANGFSGQAPIAYVGDNTGGANRGFATGLYRTFGDTAGVVGPIATTSLVTHGSYAAAFLATALLTLVAFGLFGLLASETAGRRRAPRAID